MYEGTLIDVDVHHSRADDDELLTYLPKRWREYAAFPGSRLTPAGLSTSPPEGSIIRWDAYPDDGTPPGSSYDLLCGQLLEPYGVDLALLGHDVGRELGVRDPNLALALARAMNDWSAEVWLEGKKDDRLYGALLVPTHDPEAGATEIRRAASNPRFVTAYTPYLALGKPFGHEVYKPIWEAAYEVGLPLHLHVSGGEFLSNAGPYVSGGASHQFRFDSYVVAAQPMAGHITSLIFSGVFERYPSLKLLVAEAGLSWLYWFVQRLDESYELMRVESRWVKKPPSEYLRDHVVFSTQPCEALGARQRQMVKDLTTISGIENMLCFSSDYPHWDSEDPRTVTGVMPRSWHDAIFHTNAERVLRLGHPVMPHRKPVTLDASEPAT